jgi:hypothetical protein
MRHVAHCQRCTWGVPIRLPADTPSWIYSALAIMRPSPIARLSPILLMIALLAAAAPPSRAADGTAEMMARAMAKMMEAMGLFGDGAGSGSMQFGPSPYAMPGMEQMPWMQQPWASHLGDPSQAFGMGQWMPQMPGMQGLSATGLDGVWEGRDGGLLIVQGHRFRLQSAHGGHVEGLIQRRGNRLAFYEPSTETVRPYEFVEEQGRLILRDPEGQVYLYRRLWLDDDPTNGIAK